MRLRTRVYEEGAAADEFYAAGWTDGLPIVLPTPARVEAMLAAAAVEPDGVIGGLAELDVVLTADLAATNAVMAGCGPESFPIVLAALAAALDPAFNLPVVATSTGGAAIGVVVSGPTTGTVAMGGTYNALGAGNRANATIGRAVRLTARNLLGIGSGRIDGTSIGHPGRLTLCLAEASPPEEWPPLQVTQGYDPSDTVVTVFAADGPRQVANHLSEDPNDILATFAAALKSPWHFPVGKGGMEAVLVVGPEHAAALASKGLSRADVGVYLVENTRVDLNLLGSAGIRPEAGSQHDMTPDADGNLVTIGAPEDILVVAAGGPGAGWSAVIPSWAPRAHSRRCTRRVRPPSEGLPPCGPDGCTVFWT